MKSFKVTVHLTIENDDYTEHDIVEEFKDDLENLDYNIKLIIAEETETDHDDQS